MPNDFSDVWELRQESEEACLYFKAKRVMDTIIAMAALVILSPMFGLIAAAIKLDSPGPVFFKQGRRTRNGKIFDMYKFRSMVVNAEHMGAGLFNYENDPRVTRVGHFLRKTSLDELPQLLNVTRGEMALVGPRPCVSYELGDYETLNARYKRRFQVLPGITGLAQVSGRNELSWDEKVNYDNEYIDRLAREGILLDIRILLQTVAKVFSKNSIYEERPEGMDDRQAAAESGARIIELAHRLESTEEVEEVEYVL